MVHDFPAFLAVIHHVPALSRIALPTLHSHLFPPHRLCEWHVSLGHSQFAIDLRVITGSEVGVAEWDIILLRARIR